MYTSHTHVSNLLNLSRKQKRIDSYCGSDGRAVDSYTRGPQFESSQQQNFEMNVFNVNR